MKKIFLPALVLSICSFVSCMDNTNTIDSDADSTNTASSPSATDSVANSLTQADKDAGWKLLFDGDDLDNWRVYQDKTNNTWSAKNGTLYCMGSETDKSDLRGDLITKDEFENFELMIDWKIATAGNSGLMFNVLEDSKAAYMSGPEYQMMDDIGYTDSLEDWQKTGANYAMNVASKPMAKPAGEWNHSRLLVNKGHVEHWLNGEKVVEYELWSDEWKANKAKGKWKDTPEYGMAKKGHLALQDHGSEAWFRNIKIKEL